MGIKKEELLIGWFQIFIFIPIWIRFDDGLKFGASIWSQLDPIWWFLFSIVFGGNDPIWQAYFSDGFKPPTGDSVASIIWCSFHLCESKTRKGLIRQQVQMSFYANVSPTKKSPSVLSKIPSKKTPKRLKEKNIFPKIPSKNISTDRWNWTPVSFLPGFGFQGEAEFKEQRSRQVAEEQGWCGMTQIDW